MVKLDDDCKDDRIIMQEKDLENTLELSPEIIKKSLETTQTLDLGDLND